MNHSHNIKEIWQNYLHRLKSITLSSLRKIKSGSSFNNHTEKLRTNTLKYWCSDKQSQLQENRVHTLFLPEKDYETGMPLQSNSFIFILSYSRYWRLPDNYFNHLGRNKAVKINSLIFTEPQGSQKCSSVAFGITGQFWLMFTGSISSTTRINDWSRIVAVWLFYIAAPCNFHWQIFQTASWCSQQNIHFSMETNWMTLKKSYSARKVMFSDQEKRPIPSSYSSYQAQSTGPWNYY